MEVINLALLARQKSLIYTTAMAYGDYLAQSASRELLRIRQGEIRLLPDDQLFFTTYPDFIRWLVVVSDESPDTVAVLPVLMHIAACCPRLKVRVILDDDDSLRHVARLMDDPALAAGLADADFPLLLIFDEEWHYLDQWGPHPPEIEPLLDEWLAEHPDFEQLSDDDSPAAQAAYEALLDELTQVMRLWYNSGLNQAAVADVRGVMSHLHEGGDNDDGDSDNGDSDDGDSDDGDSDDEH